LAGFHFHAVIMAGRRDGRELKKLLSARKKSMLLPKPPCQSAATIQK
jgi:hypothetical protein